MPRTFVSTDWPGVVVTDAEVWINGTKGAGLRRDYASPPDYPLPVESVIEFPNWIVESLTALWAVLPVIEGELNDQDPADVLAATLTPFGAIDCRLSVDAGATWLYWNAGWVPVTGPTDWTSFGDLNQNLGVIPFEATRQVQFQVRLRRGTPSQGPVIAGLSIGYGVMPTQEAEDAHRTMRRFFADNTRVRMRGTYPMPAAVAVLDLQHPLALFAVVAAYNLTTDPTRTTNIAAGTFTGNVLDLTGPQALGDVIEVEWDASCSVILSNPDLDFNDENLPHIPVLIVQVQGSAEHPDAKFSEIGDHYTCNPATGQYWSEDYPTPIEYRVNVFAAAADESLAIKMIGAAYRSLKDYAGRYSMPMVLTGTLAEVFEFTPPFANLTDTSENLSVKQFTCILYAREWLGGVETGPLAETFEYVLEE